MKNLFQKLTFNVEGINDVTGELIFENDACIAWIDLNEYDLRNEEREMIKKQFKLDSEVWETVVFDSNVFYEIDPNLEEAIVILNKVPNTSTSNSDKEKGWERFRTENGQPVTLVKREDAEIIQKIRAFAVITSGTDCDGAYSNSSPSLFREKINAEICQASNSFWSDGQSYYIKEVNVWGDEMFSDDIWNLETVDDQELAMAVGILPNKPDTFTKSDNGNWFTNNGHIANYKETIVETSECGNFHIFREFDLRTGTVVLSQQKSCGNGSTYGYLNGEWVRILAYGLNIKELF